MSTDAKPQPTSAPAPKRRADRGILIFTYPKIIFIFPTLVAAVICWIGMLISGNHTEVPPTAKTTTTATTVPAAKAGSAPTTTTTTTTRPTRFNTPQNMLALLFMLVLTFNLLIIAIDFPRFTVVALALFITTGLFFLLWLGIYFDWLGGLVRLLEGVYLAANANFYLLFTLSVGLMFGAIFITRWLDYWEIMPNEILHHHGPWSDLERFPTMNLKFDKEIPDIFEHFMFGAGRLVLHLPSEQKSLVLDNVLHVSKKELALKQLMSRLEVRVTTDQEVVNQP